MKRRSILTVVSLLVVCAECLNAAEPMPKYRIMMTAPATVGSPDPLFTEPCTWPALRDNIDGYKYYGRQFMGPKERRLDAKAFARFTTKAKFVVGVEFGHMFLPPKGSKQEPWRRWLTEAIAEIQPVFDAGGRVDTVHIDGAIRRLLGHGGGGGIPQRGLPYDQAMDQFVRFWVALEKNYPGIQIGYIVNFPNWDYTNQYHGLVGHFTDKSGRYFHDIISDFHTKLTKAGGTISFLEVDCPYMYYSAKKTHTGDAPVDNPGKIRALERWCDGRKIDLYMIVNEQCLAHNAKNPTPEQIAEHTRRFIDNSLLYVQAIKDDGITPELFLIQSWYGVPRVHVPETQPGTMTYAASKIAQKIHDCFGKPGQSSWMRRQLRQAVSTDGVSWKKLDYIGPDDDACPDRPGDRRDGTVKYHDSFLVHSPVICHSEVLTAEKILDCSRCFWYPCR